jgi:hypothetical protein
LFPVLVRKEMDPEEVETSSSEMGKMPDKIFAFIEKQEKCGHSLHENHRN